VDKIRGRCARSRTVPGRTRTRAWPRRAGPEPVERFALRRVLGGFQGPGASHAWPGRRFLRKQRDRGSPGASICA